MVSTQAYIFFVFFVLGILISSIYDVFRTLRRIKRENSVYVIALQDIIFFSIITIITTVCLIFVIKDNVRGYMFLAIAIGIILGRLILSKYLIAIYSRIYSLVTNIFRFIYAPLYLWINVSYKIVKKIIKKCCKLFFLVINLKCKLLADSDKNNNFVIRGLFKNEKKSKKFEEKKRKKEKVS